MDRRVEKEERAARLREARAAAGYKSDRKAAEAFRWNVNTYRAHESGRNGFDNDAGRGYARAFGVDVGWLMTGDGARERRNEVPIMGYVGAGAEILPEFEQVPPEGLDQVEVPFPVPPDLIGFEVKGDSMLPRYDEGDVIVCYREQRREIETFFGEEAAVRVEDGRRFLKSIEPGGKPQTVTLQSWNAKPIRDVKLKWLGEIYLTVRSGTIRRLNAREKATAQRRARAREQATEGMEKLALDDQDGRGGS